LYAAIEGYQESHRVEQQAPAPTMEELEALMEKFPDKKP